MKLNINHGAVWLVALALLATLNAQLSTVFAQGTAFTYQGRLNDGSGPATGIYDLRFTIYDAATSGSVVGGPLTNAPTGITNGLFTVTLDPGAGVFTGPARWLEIAVRTNGSVAAYSALAPLQPVTPTPYAIYAESGGLSSGLASGAAIGAGTGNSISPVASDDTFIGGGYYNAIGTNASSSTIGGGTQNTVQPSAYQSVIGGGVNNVVQANAYGATISGGQGNQSGGVASTIGGGRFNQIEPGGYFATIGGGLSNSVTGQYGTIPGGDQNVADYQSLAAGHRAKAGYSGDFVWADSTEADFAATAGNQFLIRAQGGVGIGKNNPATALDVNGTVTANNFVGSGAGLTGISGGLTWQTVSGTSQQAQPNTGYVVTSASQTTITLPTTPNVGDIIRVTGAGGGGWQLAQNANQFVFLMGNIGAMWTARGLGGPGNWYSVASSADGTKLVAVNNGGQIYTSTDSGVTLTARDSSRNWYSVASSADGTKLAAVVFGGYIYTSANSGVTWTAQTASGSRNWYSVASSTNGTKLVAVDGGANNAGYIFTSTDSGVTWTGQPASSVRHWTSVASSADGTKLVAVAYSDQIYISTDSGVTWTARDSVRNWWSVASSSDGTKLVAVVNGGQIYTSTDSGGTWAAQTVSASQYWYSVASSADGTKLVAVVNGGHIYTSTDSGGTWTLRDSSRNWWSVASSSDGTKLVAVVNGGQIYTSDAETTTGTAGYLTGDQNTAIELQYVGNGQFLPISYIGSIQAF
jgi:hypothetical protein